MANKYPSTFNIKRKEIQLIHVGWAQLAKQDASLDDAAYRAMLWSVARVKSSTELDFAGRKKVLDHMEACGFKRTKPQPRALADDPQSKKIRALWLELHQAGKVRNPSESALAAFVKRQTGRDALQWLNGREASTVIEELKQWLLRADKKVQDVQ